ncbi:MAG: N-acetyltransferase family protein [Balneolaceae bacterium]
MNIRTASKKDINQITEIYNQAVEAGYKTADTNPRSTKEMTEWLKNHTPGKYPVWIAEENQSIVGYLSLSPHRPGRHALRYTAEVSYYAYFDHHRKGVASQLMNHALNQCRNLEIKTLFAILLESNTPSIALLEKFNFKKWGALPRVADFNGEEIGQVYYGLRVYE